MTILIVDDEFRIGQLIRRLIHFEELGLELIDVFDDSEKALGAILLHHPDVVISDIKMPGMDVNCTPFVRQYGILFRKWGVFVCQRDNESTTELKR